MNGRSKRTCEEACDGSISDRQLLRQFVDHDDEDAFAELVSRYCGLVLGVCRRTLRDEHSAEDAFQATFLVLARRASKIRNSASLAGWLYAVAYRTALRANARPHRRHEEALRDDMTTTDDVLAEVASRYEQQLLDEELDRLPVKYREPLVLRYLLGKSNQQIAGELGLGVGVVEGRLKRGKKRLRLSLVRRGISLSVVLAAVGTSAGLLEAATTDSLLAATVQSAVAFRGGVQPTADYSQAATRLAEKELAMSTSTVATTTSGVAAAFLIAGLTFAWAGSPGPQAAEGGAPEIAATAAVPAALPAAGGFAPVLLASAERKVTKPTPASAASAAEEAIEKTLGEPAALEFIETPLADVMSSLAEKHEINIQIDQRALDDVGVPADTPITKALKGISLRSALNLMLRELDLTWIIGDEVLLITTPEEAEMRLTVKAYDVADLVICQKESGDLWADYGALIEVLTTTVAPETWYDVGGAGSITAAPFAGAEMLVIAQTSKVHEKIERLLEQLRAIAEQTGSNEPPTREESAARPRWGSFRGPGMGGMPGGMPAPGSPTAVPPPSTGSPAPASGGMPAAAPPVPPLIGDPSTNQKSPGGGMF